MSVKPIYSSLLLLSIIVAGCRTPLGPTISPEGRSLSAAARAVPAEDWLPTLKELRVWISGPHLKIHGVMDDRAPVDYGNDGWRIQALLDTDQNDATGIYSGGYDFVVRGPERLADGSLVVRITTGGGYSGGWGEAVGTARFIESDNQFSVSVPLAILKDEGNLDWRLFTLLGRAGSDYWQGSCSAPRRGLRPTT